MQNLKMLVQLPFVMLATRLTWKSLDKSEKDDRLKDMWTLMVLVDDPLLSKELESLYDWCQENY